MGFVPEQLELVHGGEADAFPHRAATGGGVANVADDDAGLLVDVFIEGRAHRDVTRAPNNGVVRHDAEGREEGVHGATHTAVEAVVFGEDLRQRAIDEVVHGQVLRGAGGVLFDDAQGVAAEVVAHDLKQVAVGKLGNGRETLGKDFSVAAMGAVDVVIYAEEVGLADGGGFLAHREVGRTTVVVFDALKAAAELDLVEHVLEGPDDLHVALDAQEVSLGKPLRRELLLAGLLILVDRDGGELDPSRTAVLDGADELALGHISS